MGYILDGISWGSRPDFVRSVNLFDQELRDSAGDMQRACLRFFRELGYQTVVNRAWTRQAASVLFVSDHWSVLDGFALPLACPTPQTVRRVVFQLSAYFVGKAFAKHSILVWPRGNYSNLVFRTRGLVDRLAYLVTHRWGPFARANRAIQKMVKALESGESVTLLPSGTIGEPRWRSGVGAVIQSTRDPQQKFLAPVYLCWDHALRKLEVNSPGLVSFQSILAATPSLDRQHLADWLNDKYVRGNWTFCQSTIQRGSTN